MAKIDYESLKKRGFLRQKQKGFFVLRTRMPAGIYAAKHLEKLKEISQEFAKGFVHLTVRQGMEVPFIKLADIPDVEAQLKAAGIQIGASGPRLRVTTSCQGNNWCKQGLVNTFSLLERIEKELNITCGLELPHKFKIAISGCPNACTRVQFSEIGIHGQVDITDPNKRIGYVIYLAGCAGRTPRSGFKLNKVFSEDEVLYVVSSVIEFFKENAKPRQRLALLVEEFGQDNFLRYIRFREDGVRRNT